MLHSDQGFEYTTQTYAKLLEEKKLTGSHSRRGNCYDNACIESFFSHLKTDQLSELKAEDRERVNEIRKEIQQVILEAAIPSDVVKAVVQSLSRFGENHAYAVRSSATAEDRG